jgi:branched-chain amino acid aminotransferase
MEAVRYIWMDGKMVPWEDATVHVLSHALHYGTGVFEGIRAYETVEGPAVFRLRAHMERLLESAKAYGLDIRWTLEDLIDATKQVIAENELESAYIRPLIFVGYGSLGLNPAGIAVQTIIAAWRWGTYLGDHGAEHGVRVKVSSWRRLDHETFIPNAKGASGYINSILANREAVEDGYDEAIMLNTRGLLAEGSGENIFIVRHGEVFTPPVSAGILEGITRDAVMQLLADDGHPVIELELGRSDLYRADEMFFTGTAAEVTPVREVDRRTIGDGEPGPITKRAQELFPQAVRGELAAYRHWLEFV